MANYPTGFQARIDAFNEKVALKRTFISAKAEELKKELLKHTPVKQEKVQLSSLLDNPVDKDFGTEWKFNAARDALDADTVKAISPYTQFYGQTVDGVKDRTVTEPVRLGGQHGTSIDTYETRKIVDGVVQPYPANKKYYHQVHYAQQHNLPSYTMVSDDMLFDAAEEQTTKLLENIYKGITWNDYGEKLADGSTVPFPNDVQQKLDTLKADLKIATQRESEETQRKEDRVPIATDTKLMSKAVPFIPEWVPDPQDLAAKAINLFDRLKDNVTEDLATKSVKEIEKEIATLKIATNAKREVDPSVLTGDVNIDIQVNGVGIYDRKLGVLINPTTGDNINTKVNTPADNPAYMSKYNRAFVNKLTQNVRDATLREYGTNGYGFWKQTGIALEGGIDTLQALGFSGAAYLVELLPNEIRSKFGNVPILLPDVSKMFGIDAKFEWNTPEAYGAAWLIRYQEKLEDARRVDGRMPIIEEIDWSNGKQVLSKIGDAFGEGLPSISFMIGSGGVGGVAAKTLFGGAAKNAATNAAKKLALKRIQVIGSRVGVGSSAIGLQTASIWGDVATGPDADKSWRAKGLTLVGGIASGSLEMLFPMTFFRKAGMPLKTTNGIKKRFSARLATLGATIAKESAAGGITEGTTEGLQFIIEEITQEYIKSGELPDFASEEFKSGFWNSVFAGFVPGGGIRMASSTISGLNKVITRDTTEVKKAVQEARNEAGEVENKEVAGEADFESQKILATQVGEIEELASTLDIDLNKEYKKKTNLDKGIELSDTLNDLEIAQKELPVAERNTEILSTIEKARESLNIALNNVNTGDSFVKSNTQATVIENNRDKQIERLKKRYASLIANVKDKKISKKFNKAWKQKKIKSLEKELKDKILIQENKATKALEPILKRAKEGRIKGTKVLQEKIRANIKKINAITKKLEDPKLSKKQRKRLIYKRNALAAVIDGMSRDGKGRLDTLAKGTVENIENIVASDWYENRKVSSRTKAETKEKIKTATQAFKDYKKEKNKKKPDRASLQKLKSNAIKLYNELTDIIPQLRKDLAETTDRALKARLVIDLEKFNKLKAELEKEFAKDQEIDIEIKKEEQKAKPKEDILNSLDIDSLNEGLTEQEEEILGSLNPEEEGNVNSRKKVAAAAKKIKKLLRYSGNLKKSLTQVHNEIIKGKEGHFLGIETFLKQTRKRQLNKSKLVQFISGFVNKSAALKEAFKLYEKTGETVYVNKNTNEIFENLKAVPKKDRKPAVLNKNYWYLNSKSKRLLTFIAEEVIYIEEIRSLIIDIQSNLEKIDEVTRIKQKENLDTIEADKILRQNVETTGTLEDVVTPTEDAPIDQETTTEEIDYSNPDEFVLPEFMWKFEKKLRKFGGMLANIQVQKVDGVIQSMKVRISDATPYFINGKRATEKDFESKAEFEKWLKLQAKLEADQNTARKIIARIKETTKKEAIKQEVKPQETKQEEVKKEVTKPETTETKKEKRTRERARLNALEKELTEKNTKLKAELDALNKLEKKKGSLTRRNEIKAIKNQIKINKRRLELEVRNKQDARDVAEDNHWLNKFKDTFNKLKDSDIKIRELFQIKDLSRRSIFSLSNSKNLVTIKEDGTVDTSGITSKLIELGVTDKAYIKSIADNFVKFRTIFYKNINESLDKDELKFGSYTVRESKLFLDKDGNMPDDILFAMMLTLLHWSAINQKGSETRPLFTIANLLFADPKQIGRLDREQITTFIDTGIFVKDASKEIGLEILDMLNIKIKEPTIQSIYLRLENIVNKAFNQPVSYRSNLKPRLATALGLLTLQTARYMNAQGRVKQGDPKEGLIEVVRGEYDIELFDNPNLIFTEQQQKKKTIDWNSVQIEDDPELDIYRENAENLKLIKGTESFIRDTYEVAVEDVQEETDNSFFKLNKKIKRVILKLQSVRWEGKRFELKLFKALSKEASDMLLDIKDLNTVHDESKDSVEAANNEKLRDKDHVLNYINSGDNPGFYFRYKAQIQHRLRIVSNTINGQRSKVHRFLFNPTGSETKVTTDSHKAIFKLAVIQAFGYNITTLKEGLATFEKIRSNENVKKLVMELQKADLNEELFNELLIKIMEEKDLVDSVSTHLLEGLNALSQYHTAKYRPKKTFVTAIGIETDGTTNGYAISLLQFLDGDVNNPKDLKDALARVGVYVGTKESKDTYERFVASGKDDVYQSFSRQIATAIFGTTSRFNEVEQNIITALHGELLKDGVLTKFARDLAKIPVMVSNYGGSLYKIIQNVIGEIIPNIYDNLADIQTRYNAGNEVDKVTIRKELQVIQDAINNIPKIKKVDLLSRLDKTGSTTDKNEIVTQNNLYGFIFTSSSKRSIGQIERIENFFEEVYAGEDAIFENALEDLLEPTMEAREALVKIVEAEYFIFRIAYDKAIGDLGLGAVDIDIKMQIAADLADELMPRATVPWAEAEGQLLQLIKFTDSKDNRVEVKTKPFKNQKYKKQSKEWIESGEPISERRIGANTTSSDFDSPGVGSAVNQTQNMDSTVIGDLLDQKQQVLPLFDAVISSVTTVQENADIYNDSFLIRNLEHVFLEETLAQFKIILANAKKYKITTSQINDLLQTESHRAKAIIKEIEEGDDGNAAELDSMTIEKLQKDLEKKVKSRKDNLLTLLDTYGNADNLTLKELKKLNNKNLNDLIVRSWRVSQMPLPESIKDPSLEPTDIAETGTSTGSETDAKQTEVASSQGDPGNANTNIDEGQAAIDAIEREQREAFEAEELAEQIENDKANVEADKEADAARKLRQTLYTNAENKVLEIIDRLSNKNTQVLVNNSIASLARVKQVQLNDKLVAPEISFNLNQIVDDYNRGMLYIQGKGVGLHDSKKTKESSEQKRRVFANIDIKAFKEHIEQTGGLTAYIEFIFQHELGHIVNKHHEIDTGGLLTPESIAKEREANDYAFKAIGFNNPKPKIVTEKPKRPKTKVTIEKDVKNTIEKTKIEALKLYETDIETIYYNSPALQKIGSITDYNRYVNDILNGVIPNQHGITHENSVVQDIVYHGTPETVIFDEFDDSKAGVNTFTQDFDSQYGFFFTNRMGSTLQYGVLSIQDKINRQQKLLEQYYYYPWQSEKDNAGLKSANSTQEGWSFEELQIREPEFHKFMMNKLKPMKSRRVVKDYYRQVQKKLREREELLTAYGSLNRFDNYISQIVKVNQILKGTLPTKGIYEIWMDIDFDNSNHPVLRIEDGKITWQRTRGNDLVKQFPELEEGKAINEVPMKDITRIFTLINEQNRKIINDQRKVLNKENMNPLILSVALNIQSPLIHDLKKKGYTDGGLEIQTEKSKEAALDETYDSAIFNNVRDPHLMTSYLALNSEQIHIFGSAPDVDNFKNYAVPEQQQLPIEESPFKDSENDVILSLENSVKKDLKRIYRTNSLRGNLQAIFETLGEASIDSYRNKDDKNTQQLQLQRVLDEIISKAGSELDRTQLTLNRSNVKSDGSANPTQTSVNVNINRFKPLSYSEQTSQEVYAHELIHILTRFAIKHDSVFKRKLEDLRDQVIAEIERTEVRPYEIFLNKDEQGKIIYKTSEQAEIDAAKKQYNYVFGDTVPAKYKLDEFLAYALTNKYIVAKTANMESKNVPLWSKNENRRISEKIIEFFAELLNRVTNTLSRKQKPLTVQQEIFELTRDIVDVNQSKRASLAKSIGINIVAKGINRGNDEGAKLLAYAWSKGGTLLADTWIKMVDKATRDGKINNFLAKVLYDTKLVAYLGSSYKDYVDVHPEVQKKLNVIYRNIKPSFLKNASSLWINGFGGETLDFIRLLYQSHKDIDADRKAFKENSKKNLRKLFLTFDDLTTTQKESITRVMLKTDLSSLIVNKAFTQDEILELIRDESKLDKAIKKYEGSKKLNIRNNNYYRIQISQLANYMMTGDTYAYEQKLNASNIYKTGIARHRAYKKVDREQEIKDIDTYITLLALKAPGLTYAKQDVDLVMQNELAQEESTKTENAFIGLLNVHVAFKEESKNTLFLDRQGKPSDALMAKGYIATVTDDDAKITVEKSDPESKAKMLKDGYTFIANVENFTKEPYGMYVIYNYPTEPRTKGIASLKSNRFMGTDIREIFSRNPEKAGFIMQELDKVKRKQQKLARKGKLSKIPTMIPLMDEDINVNTFRYTLSHTLAEQHLKQDLQFDEVMSTMESHKVDKVNSKEINRDTVALLYKHGKENYSKKPNKFVNILDNIYEDEYFRPLPKDMKQDVLYHSRINKDTGKEEFWVERKLLDTVFGYQNPSIANISVLQNSDKYKRYSKISEKFWKEWIAIAKVNIVVRTPIVPAINFLSNGITSWMYGVPLPYIIKYWREAAIELSDYRANAEKLKDLDFRIKANPELANKVAVKNRRDILVADMNQNKVAPFVTQGLFNSITEDINEDEFTYRNKLFTKLKRTKGGKLIKGRALDIANMAYLGEKTKIFKEATHFLQISDFIARYALYKYQTEVAGKSADQAYKTMIETFVNYDQPLNRYLAYTNDMGVIMFVKYWVRIQRAGFNLMREKPLNAALLFVGNGFFDLDIETILESSIFTGNLLPTYGGIENNFEQVVIPPGLEILMGRGF